MGDLNPFAPTLLGLEPVLTKHRVFRLNDSKIGLLMRVVPDAAITLTQLHLLTTGLAGAPGLVYEIRSNDDPAITTTRYLPGFDDLATGYEDNAGGAAGFADVDDRSNPAEFIRNAAAMKVGAAVPPALSFPVRGNTVLAGVRVLSVVIGGEFSVANNASTTTPASIRGRVRINNIAYTGPTITKVSKGAGGPT